MHNRRELDISQPFSSPDRPDGSQRAELTGDEKDVLRKAIRSTDKTHILGNIDRFLAEPDMARAGGSVLVKTGFGENLLHGLSIDGNPMLDSSKVAADINRAVQAGIPAGEELTSEKKDALATDILRIIHEAVR